MAVSAIRHNWPRIPLRSMQLQALALRDGQNTQALGQSAFAKIFHFTEIRICRTFRSS
jgi:hypothetical protein